MPIRHRVSIPATLNLTIETDENASALEVRREAIKLAVSEFGAEGVQLPTEDDIADAFLSFKALEVAKTGQYSVRGVKVVDSQEVDEA